MNRRELFATVAAAFIAPRVAPMITFKGKPFIYDEMTFTHKEHYGVVDFTDAQLRVASSGPLKLFGV